jgi:hypothetical protein
MREKLVRMPSRNDQPRTAPEKPTPTEIITARPRKMLRSSRRPTFCAASRSSRKRARDRKDRVTLAARKSGPGRKPGRDHIIGRDEHAVLTDLGRDAVDEDVLIALRRVQELEALARVGGGKAAR